MGSQSAVGDIQDILTDMDADIYREGANDFEEITVIENDDITILEDQAALWNGIVANLKTPRGYIDGVGLENFGSKLLTLRGMNLNYHIAQLAEVYIRDTIPDYQGYVIDFPNIEITEPHPTVKDRMTMKIKIEVDSIFGPFVRDFYI